MNSIKDYQVEILKEIPSRYSRNSDVKGCIVSLPMGYGKTFLSYYAIKQKSEFLNVTENRKGLFLVVCSKSLILNWINEIEKFGFDINYEVLHSSYIKNIHKWKPKPDTELIITTPETVTKSYKINNIEDTFVRKKIEITRVFADGNTNYYFLNDKPYGILEEGEPLIHSLKFDMLFIDEFHNYTTINTIRSKGLVTICSENTWLLSGTPFQEVDHDRILGTLLLLRHKYYRDLKTVINAMRNRRFEGISRWSVIRKDKTPPGEKLPELISNIDSFDLSVNERLLYTSLRSIIKILYDNYKKAVEDENKELTKKIGGNLLSMIAYLRQSLIIPQVAIVKIIAKMDELDSEEIVKILNDILNKYKIKEWIETEDSIRSSRIIKFLEVLGRYPNGKIIVFSNFTELTDIIKGFVREKYPYLQIYNLDSKMTIEKRRGIINSYNESIDPSVMFLSYQMGSEGLNLQSANVVINMDFFWNQGKENQSLSRMYRIGQKNDIVFQHMLVSNTGIEKSMLTRKHEKLITINGVMDGSITDIKKTGMTFKSITDIIDLEINEEMIGKIKNTET